MSYFSVSSIASAFTILYLAYMFYTFWVFLTPPVCHEEKLCIHPLTERNPKLHVALFTSSDSNPSSNEVNLLYRKENFDYQNPFEKSVRLPIPYTTRNNGTLFVHLFVTTKNLANFDTLVSNRETVYSVSPLSKFLVPDRLRILLSNSTKKQRKQDRKVVHIKKSFNFVMMADNITLPRTDIPGDLYTYLRVVKRANDYFEYLPIVVENELLDRTKNMLELNRTTTETELLLNYVPVGYEKLRFQLQMGMAMQAMTQYGFQEKDMDDIKSIVQDTNFYLIMITVTVSMIHMLFDFLALKNDVQFWNKLKTLEGLSARTIIWRAFSQTIIFLYLFEEKASLLIIVPTFIAVLIEMWKVQKVVPIDWRRFKLKRVELTTAEKRTREYDAESMRYLSYLLYPLCFGGALYSLLYEPHRSWYSWVIKNLVNGVYAFGFLFMLPQLFVNFKLKSVAHLPWKTFMYKAFNTFIDDLFAFIIDMPTAHRIACFRDDIVFLAYMYQRWLYPVDKTRVDTETEVSATVPSKTKKKSQ